jgi:hypothetical protein
MTDISVPKELQDLGVSRLAWNKEKKGLRMYIYNSKAVPLITNDSQDTINKLRESKDFGDSDTVEKIAGRLVGL